MTRRAFAPGRVNLIGEYTDLAGGLALPVAIDLGVTVEAEPASEWEIEEHLRPAVAALGVPPARVRISSTLPIGRGLSSSAAVHVALALALTGARGLDLALAAQRAEHASLGVPSGLLDQLASVFGRAGHAVLLDFTTLAHEHVPLPEDVAIVVLDSGVARRNADSGYARRKAELDAGVPARVRHVESENRRVREVVAAFRAGDLARVGELFREGHESMRVDFEASVPAVDALVERAYAEGAIAARITGGGFGGSVVALVEDAESFAARFDGAIVTAAGDGAREL